MAPVFHDSPLALSNRDASRSSNTAGRYFVVGPLDPTSFKGQTIEIAFHVTSNRTRPTVFRIDDVSLRDAP
jgi:hypothetical protein